MHFLVAKKIVRDIKISIANNHILTTLSKTQGKQEQFKIGINNLSI